MRHWPCYQLIMLAQAYWLYHGEFMCYICCVVDVLRQLWTSSVSFIMLGVSGWMCSVLHCLEIWPK